MNFSTAVHIPQVVETTFWLAKQIKEANPEIAVLGAWLHDVGHLWFDDFVNVHDHAVRGEIKTRAILTDFGADGQTITAVTHIVKSHRNRDVAPATIEAKIVAASDSASHLQNNTYEKLIVDEKLSGTAEERVKICLEKLERDWWDISVFPELVKEMNGKYERTKELLTIALSKS